MTTTASLIPPNAAGILAASTVTAGFDGFVDSIAMLIRSKQRSTLLPFANIKAFGSYVLEKKGSSFSLEWKERSRKPGGNMPILSHALGSLGVHVNCIGGTGYPKPNPVFDSLSPRCHLYGFTEPGLATAFEFTDGKIMLAQMDDLHRAGWKTIRKIIGVEKLVSLYRHSDLICLLNWSEIDASTTIWNGLLKEIIPRYAGSRDRQPVFIDLSDCSKRNASSLEGMLRLLKRFSRFFDVTLSLNHNEARCLYRTLYKKNTQKGLAWMGEKIASYLKIDTLLLHSTREAILFRDGQQVSRKSFFVQNPTLSTGAGDNFNAGFCAATLLKLDPVMSLTMAHAVAACYVQTGTSPGWKRLERFIHTHAT